MFRATEKPTRAQSAIRRRATAAFLSFGLSAMVIGSANASVRVMAIVHSSRHPQIQVTYEGKPVAGATVAIFRGYNGSGNALFTVETDDKGLAVFPKIATGEYRVYVKAVPKLWGSVDLEVSQPIGKDPGPIQLQLDCCTPPTYEETVASAEQAPIHDRLQSLSGVVVDPSGAFIPKVEIDVVLKGTEGKTHVARIRSDNDGRFTAPLADGEYVIFFNAPGFRSLVIPIAISHANGQGELRAKLRIGPSS